MIRRKALRAGIFGSSRFWKVVAYTMFGTRALRRAFGKHPEVLEIATMKGPGHIMQIETFPRLSRRQRRRAAG
jgi:hypothetical protein